MERLWGEMLPVPEANLEVLSGGETMRDGWKVAYTPGHASHHVSYLHDGTAFVGDVGGVRITPNSMTVPPTPPPDIDVEAWHESIATVRAWRPERLVMTHFGSSDDVERQLDELGTRLDAWSALARDVDLDTSSPPCRRRCDARATPRTRPPTSRRRRWSSCTPATNATGANGRSSDARR